MFVIVARAGLVNEVGLIGRRPGILAVFIEDIDHADWSSQISRESQLGGRSKGLLAHTAARGWSP
jgi:hypothetical protein